MRDRREKARPLVPIPRSVARMPSIASARSSISRMPWTLTALEIAGGYAAGGRPSRGAAWPAGGHEDPEQDDDRDEAHEGEGWRRRRK